MSASIVGERKDIDQAVDRLFQVGNAQGREQALRALFVEKLDFDPAKGAINVPAIDGSGVSPAQIIAERDGVTVVYVSGPSDTVPTVAAVRKLYQASKGILTNLVLVCATRDGRHWQFVYPRPQGDKEVLHKLSVQRGQPRRTFVEQLSKLAANAQTKGIRGALEELYNVEAVTRAFFTDYKRVFNEEVMPRIRGFENADDQRLFCQTLFNRLMFLYFLQRKGCLKFGGSEDYLSTLWHNYEDTIADGVGTFYRTCLHTLFFVALSNDRSTDFKASYMEPQIGIVPFLNGGLFAEDNLDKRHGVDVEDAAIKSILLDLFEKYNFTITESTPYEIEVAVDPEMLGKVFEELVTGRHESGSYYTPRPIVSFMGKEALKGYFAHALPEESAGAISGFVDEHSTRDLRNPATAWAVLKRVRVCDPACGSGAYLLGMLQELLALRTCIWAEHKLGPEEVYKRKLEIIQENLYGVDLDPFAVNIARLRLWLSLIVDFVGDRPPPLPNLDFKIEVGDSLTAPAPQPPQAIDARHALLQEYQAARRDHMNATGEEKKELERRIEALRQGINNWTYITGSPPMGFDWSLEFGDVFEDGGFDIVLANPPYVRQELIKEQKPALKTVYGDLYSGIADLYIYFYYRALQLLKPGGMLVFISSNKWFRAGYGIKLRNRMTAACHVKCIIDFGDLPVFESAAAYPMIFVAQNHAAKSDSTIFTQIESLNPPYPDIDMLVQQFGHVLPTDAMSGSNWVLTRATSADLVRKMLTMGTPLGEYVHGQIHYGVKTGFNTAFVIDGAKRAELIARDPRSADVIKPLIVGRDIQKWCVVDQDRWFIYSPWELKIEDYPAIMTHLSKWRRELEARPECVAGRYNWWCMARYGAESVHLFDQPKIVYQQIATYQSFSLDTTGSYVNDKVFVIPEYDLYLLGVLNAKPAWEYLNSICSKLAGGALEMRTPYLNSLPIPNASIMDRTAIAALVQRCLDAKGHGPDVAVWEAEIDERVSRLYGLDVSDLQEAG